MLRGPADEAGVTGDQPGGELAADVGQALVDQEQVVVVGLLVGPTCGSPGGSPLVHERR